MQAVSLTYHELYPTNKQEYLDRTGHLGVGKREYALSDSMFRSHLESLTRLGFRVTRFDTSPGPLEFPSMWLTFDDGGVSNFEIARPALAQHGWPAHFFVSTNLIGQPRYMTREQVCLLDQEGHLIGAHGATHAMLSTLSEQELEYEIRSSKDALETWLNHPCESFALPGGMANGRVYQQLKAAGYRMIFTSLPPFPLLHRYSPIRCGRWTMRPNIDSNVLKALLTGQLKTVFPTFARALLPSTLRRFLGYERYLRFRNYLLKR